MSEDFNNIHALNSSRIEKLLKDASDVDIEVTFSNEDTGIQLLSKDGCHILSLSGKKDLKSNLRIAQKWMDTFNPMSEEEYDLLNDEEDYMSMVENGQCPF